MSKWNVLITPDAASDIKNIYSYVADVLLEKNTAKTAGLVSSGQISIEELRSNEKAKIFSGSLKQLVP